MVHSEKGHGVIQLHMRPNIQITHQLNGRVKDYAAENDLDLDEAYRQIIEVGLGELEDDEQ